MRREIPQAAEQRSELSPRRGLASLGYGPLKVIEPRRGDRELITGSDLRDRCRLFGARSFLGALTQGSQSLALGLILTAAPQLVEGSRLTSNGCQRIGTTFRRLLGLSLVLSACHLAATAPPLSAGTLLREYQQSSTDARRKYDGKEISVRGLALSAASLPLGGTDEGSVWLQESDRETSGKVGCWFSSQQAADFSRIVSGRYVTIKGVFNGEAGVDLKFCRLVNVE